MSDARWDDPREYESRDRTDEWPRVYDPRDRDYCDPRDALMRVLRMLPPQQRTVIVLRYWEQLSEAETATVLGCSEGTVKSAASRGLQRMRELTRSWQEPGGGPERDTKSGLGTGIKLAEGRS